jgi:hypothetical protein
MHALGYNGGMGAGAGRGVRAGRRPGGDAQRAGEPAVPDPRCEADPF